MQSVETQQTTNFYGQEKTRLAGIIDIMNMVLHGIETQNFVRPKSLMKS